ncbi:MAG: sulfate permease [Thiotrichaceae bacterium]|nr:sulfate permease [Thiotrichaceae bacterium]
MLSLLAEWKNRFIPFMEWIHVLKDKSVIKADLMAGLTVALVLVPQSMAYADLAKLPPYVGLYASFIPVIIASLFGSSRQLATGPVAMVSLMTAGAIGMLGFSDNPEQAMFYAAFLAIMVGAIQLSLGLFRLGVLVDFLSHPVIIGFTNAAALIIASSQISKLFGLTIEGTFEHHYEKVWAIVQAIPETHIVTLAMGALSIFILVYVKKINPRLPNVLIAVVICTLISHFTGYAAKGGAVIGLFDSELPSFSIPQIDYARIGELVMIAFMIALIGFVEAISVAKAIASQTRQRLSANQELVGQGLANIAAGLFQAYPVSGSFSRSAVNFTAGAKTALSAIVTGILVAITILFLTSYLKNLPQATLAAVIIVAVAGLIKIEPIKHAWKVHRHDGIISVIVFIATLVAAPHLEQGVLVGVVLSLGLFLYRTMSPRLLEVARHEDTTLRDAKRFGLKTSDTVSVMRYDGDLYFANAGYLEGKLLNLVASKPKLKVIVLDIEAVDQLDSSGEEMLKQLYDRLQTVGIELYFARAKKQIIDAFIRSGLYAHIGDKYFFRQRTDAVKAAKEDLGDAIDISSYLKPIHNG